MQNVAIPPTRTRRLAARANAMLCGTVIASMLAFAAPAGARDHDRNRGQRCESCGTVVTTNRKDEQGSGTAGTVVGGVGGAVAGNVLGHNTTSTVLGPYQLQEDAHASYWGQLAMRNCLRLAYNAGAVRGGKCVRSANGLNSRGEPNMALQ